MSSTSETSPREVRRRGKAVERGVLEATISLLTDQGAAITVDDVAALSGVHKTTIYRRFETRELLIAAAVREFGARAVPQLSNDDPRVALDALARSVAAAVRSPQGANLLRSVIAASASAPELVALADDYFRDRYELALTHLRRLATEGSLSAAVDPVVVWEQIANPMHVRALCGRQTSDAEASQLVELALRGAAS